MMLKKLLRLVNLGVYTMPGKIYLVWDFEAQKLCIQT